MICYNYAALHPPAPFVNLTLRNPVDGTEVQDSPAQLDTAADRTLLPERLVHALKLAQVGNLEVGAVGGARMSLPLHLVELAINGLSPRVVEVVAHPGENWVLLGRDVLNHYRLMLDGPALRLEIH